MLRYAISDGGLFSADEASRTLALAEQIRRLSATGVEFFQLREKDRAPEAQDTLMAALVKARGDRPIPRLLLNASVPEALGRGAASGADGVHVPGAGLSIAEADALRESFARRSRPAPVLSVSCHHVEDIRRARKAGVSLALFGPVFEKRVRGERICARGMGLQALRYACAEAGEKLPVLALGGVTEANAGLCLAAGAAGDRRHPALRRVAPRQYLTCENRRRTMLIKPIDLQDEPLLIHASLAAESMEYTPDVRQIGPLAVEGQADLLVEHRGPREFVEDIRLRASYRGRFELLCARCLDPVPQELEGSFDLIFRPENADADSGERAITEEETEIGYYEKSGLPLEDVVREQVLLSLPSRTLCQEDCRGLCQHCGQNLNAGICGCEEASADPRWNALAGLAGKLKQ